MTATYINNILNKATINNDGNDCKGRGKKPLFQICTLI